MEKHERIERLVLSGGGDILVHREIGEKRLDFRCAHFARMTLMVKEDEPLDPEDVNLFGVKRAMFDAENFAHLVEGIWLLDWE